MDEKPICIKSCYVDIAHGYTKKRHVFKLITTSGSEYLLQAEDHKDMVSWIQVIDDRRNPDKEVRPSPLPKIPTSYFGSSFSMG